MNCLPPLHQLFFLFIHGVLCGPIFCVLLYPLTLLLNLIMCFDVVHTLVISDVCGSLTMRL